MGIDLVKATVFGEKFLQNSTCFREKEVL
jgi:hypothetical protein